MILSRESKFKVKFNFIGVDGNKCNFDGIIYYKHKKKLENYLTKNCKATNLVIENVM